MNLFEVTTPLAVRVRVTRERWLQIVTFKHPVMGGREQDVELALADPDQVRRSRSDPDVLLFYRLEQAERWTCAVVKHVQNDEAFLITAYPADAIKEGEQIWTK